MFPPYVKLVDDNSFILSEEESRYKIIFIIGVNLNKLSKLEDIYNGTT